MKRTVAINFSDYSIEALELDQEKRQLIVKAQSRITLAPGIIENGKIIQYDICAAAVQQLLANAQPSPVEGHDIAITIPESRMFAQTFSLPRSIPQQQVPSALFSEARESMPLDVKAVAADFRLTGRTDTADQYLFAATYDELVKEYVLFFQKLRLKVTLITMESLALGAAVLDETVDETVLLLDIGARTTIASIFQKGELRESININIAGNAITAALAEKLRLALEEAEQRKITMGLTPGTDGGAEMLVIQGQLQPLKDELATFIRYYEQRSGDLVDRIMLSGGTASMVGLADYFAANLNRPTVAAEALPLFAVDRDRTMLPKFLVVLGLARIAMGGRQERINFLEHKEKDWQPTKKAIRGTVATGSVGSAVSKRAMPSRKRLLLLAAVLVLAGGLVGFLWWLRSSSSVKFPVANLPESESAPQVVIVARPFAEVTNGRQVSFTFWASLQPDPAHPGDIPGRIENLSPRATVAYDDAILDYVRRTLTAAGTTVTDDALQQGLREYLSDQVWQEKQALLQQTARNEGLRVLDDYASKEIVTAEALTETKADGSTVRQLNFSLVFRALLVKESAFAPLEQQQVADFQELNPGWVPTRRQYRMKLEEGSTRVLVSALYTFLQQP